MKFNKLIFRAILGGDRNSKDATVAQPVEQYFRKVEVPGSIPGSGSIVSSSYYPCRNYLNSSWPLSQPVS